MITVILQVIRGPSRPGRRDSGIIRARREIIQTVRWRTLGALAAMSLPSVLLCPPEHVPQAVDLILSDHPPEARQEELERVLLALARGEATERWLVMLAANQVLAVVRGQLQPGRAALVWPPRSAPGLSGETWVHGSRMLVDELLRWLAEEGIELAQALIPSDAGLDAACLRACGFEYLTDLWYLVNTALDPPAAFRQPPLEFQCFDPADPSRLAAVLEATYEATLDCPRLNDARQTPDVLAGYRAVGEFSPQRWWYVRNAGQDVGCLLLADHPPHCLELVYMGLTAAARGRGWGEAVVGQALAHCRASGRRQVVVAADAHNTPAVKLYERTGFYRWAERAVYAYFFRGKPARQV